MQKSRSPGSLYLPKFVAEGEGFEPPDPFESTVFKTAAFNRSANLPAKDGAYYTKSAAQRRRTFSDPEGHEASRPGIRITASSQRPD